MTEALLTHLRGAWCAESSIDLVTCYGGEPSTFDGSHIYRVSDYPTNASRGELVRELKARDYAVIAILCSGEPIMTKWKWMLALRLPAKLLIVNESCDYFWAQYDNIGTIRRFVLIRAGLAGEGSLRTLARLCIFPFSVLFLVIYAAAVHLRRRLRLANPIH